MSASFFHRLGAFVILVWLAVGLAACSSFVKGGDNRHNIPLSSTLVAALRSIDSSPGAGMVVRIFKKEEVLEVWKRSSSGQYRLLKTYEICSYSGDLGPKFKEGDRQSPEGFYTISPGLMNPKSAYYLAFNTGFPNKFDRSHGRTGSNLMVHGDCKSVGCYAMTDAGIAEIYALARETFKGGNPSFQLQIFPFRMTTANLAQEATNPHFDFWKNIKDGYDYFELTKTPPVWDVCEQRYIFNPATNAPLDALGACPPVVANAAVTARQQADNAALANQADAIRKAAERQVAEQEAVRQRGAAVSGFFSGIGSVFGGTPAQPAIATPVMNGDPASMPTPESQRP
ncbi:L,D-transpeptidase family protein [Devosia chinhatensis]|uniref:L,D-transpeptidase family protein n=1 Tax=Devosia chinhatensis TaxID=429727 RepID=UPI000A463861|nr:murein L,D-transpeptidase family protein [Devosia chinhatensis]